MLFQQVIERYIHYLITLDRSNETIRSYRVELNCLNRFIEERHNGPVYLEDIQLEDFEEYLYHLKMKGDAPATRRRMVYIIKAFYNFCIKKDILEKNLSTKLDAIPITQKEREYLTHEEFYTLIDGIEHRLVRLIVITLFYTGLRIRECLNLTLNDIDFDKHILLIRNTKSKKDRRVPIHDNLIPLLQDYIHHWRDVDNSIYLFATTKTGRVSPGYVNYILHQTTEKLRWNKIITCHILRHSFASNLVKKKIDLVKIQKLLGHSSLKVTGIYTHVDTSDLCQAVNVL